jgi:hypothetical protein
MKKLVAIFCFLLVFSFNVSGQDKTKKTLIINTYECFDAGYCKIIVTEDDKKLEEIALQTLHAKNLDQNQITITKTISKYKNQGYNFITAVRGAAPATQVVNLNIIPLMTTYLFEK